MLPSEIPDTMTTPAELARRLAAREEAKHSGRYVPSMTRGLPNGDVWRDYRRALRNWNRP